MLKRVSFMSLALASLPLATARAGIEFVTSAASCASKVITAGQTLTVLAGPNVQFEVWGNSVDLAPTIKFGGALTGATIVARHSGPDNASRGCGFVRARARSPSTAVRSRSTSRARCCA